LTRPRLQFATCKAEKEDSRLFTIGRNVDQAHVRGKEGTTNVL